MDKQKPSGVVDARLSDPMTGEITGEIRAIHVRSPKSAYRSYRFNPEFGWKGRSVDLHMALRQRMKAANMQVVE